MKKIRTIQAVVLEEKKLRVCAYVRVSTDQAEQKNRSYYTFTPKPLCSLTDSVLPMDE